MTSRARRAPLWVIIPVWIFLGPLYGTCFIITAPATLYREQKEKQKQRTRPLPRFRKRALTLGSSAPWYSKVRRQRTYDQSKSSFLRLPWDLREMIYKQVMELPNGQDLHVAMTGRRLCGIPCGEAEFGRRSWEHNCWGPIDHQSLPEPTQFRPRRFLGLLCSCRQIYSESIELLYTRNTLNFRHTKSILAMEKVVVPHRLNSISSLHLDTIAVYHAFNHAYNKSKWPTGVIWYWKEACEIISRMQGLTNLRVTLTKSKSWNAMDDPDTDGLVWLLQPLMAVQAPNFLVDIYWPGAVDLDAILRGLGGRTPFSIEVKITDRINCSL